jgi:hypothetical protein
MGVESMFEPKRSGAQPDLEWRRAVGITVGVWLLNLWFSGARVSALSHAVAFASISACAGVLAWTIYRLISRRDDGLIVFLLAGLLGPRTSASQSSFLTDVEVAVDQAAIVVLLRLVCGLLCRGKTIRKAAAES